MGAAFALLACGLGVWLYLHRGLNVRIHNADAQALRSVVVRVTGNSYLLGDLPPGSTVSVRVEPTGESSVHIEFQDSAGHSKSLNADVYLESGYQGTLSLDVTPQRITITRNSVTYP